MEIGTEQTVFYIMECEIENYRRAGFQIKDLHRERGDNIRCFLAIEPTTKTPDPKSSR